MIYSRDEDSSGKETEEGKARLRSVRFKGGGKGSMSISQS